MAGRRLRVAWASLPSIVIGFILGSVLVLALVHLTPLGDLFFSVVDSVLGVRPEFPPITP